MGGGFAASFHEPFLGAGEEYSSLEVEGAGMLRPSNTTEKRDSLQSHRPDHTRACPAWKLSRVGPGEPLGGRQREGTSPAGG